MLEIITLPNIYHFDSLNADQLRSIGSGEIPSINDDSSLICIEKNDGTEKAYLVNNENDIVFARSLKNIEWIIVSKDTIESTKMNQTGFDDSNQNNIHGSNIDKHERDGNKSCLSISKDILLMALPISMVRVIASVNMFVGVVVLSRINTKTLQASPLIFSTQGTIFAIALTPLYVISSLGGHAFGAAEKCKESQNINEADKNYSKIGVLWQQGYVLGGLIAIPSIAVMYFASPMLQLFGQNESLADIAQVYFRAYLWGVPALMWVTTNNQLVYAIKKQNLAFFMSLASLPVFLLSGYALVYGKFGFPALEVAGVGYAFTCQIWFNFLSFKLLFWCIRNDLDKYQLLNFSHQKGLSTLWELIKIGFPYGTQVIFEVISLYSATLMTGILGEKQLAAQHVLLQYSFMLVAPRIGFSQAAGTLVGDAYGAKKYFDMKRYGYLSMLMGTGVMTTVFTIFTLFPELFISPYIDVHDSNNAQIISLLKPLLMYMTAGQLLDFIRLIGGGALRGVKDTTVPMLISFASLGAVTVPLSYVLSFTLKYGLKGIYLAQETGMTLGAGLIFQRWSRVSNDLSKEEKVSSKKESAGFFGYIQSFFHKTAPAQNSTSVPKIGGLFYGSRSNSGSKMILPNQANSSQNSAEHLSLTEKKPLNYSSF